MKDKYSDVIKKFTPYGPIPHEEWEALTSLLVRKEIAAGDYFENAGNLASEFCYVEKGLFRSFYRNGNGDEFIKNFAFEGQLLGSFTSLLTAKPSELSIQAIESSIILVLDYKIFLDFFQRHRCWETGARLIAEYVFMESERKEHQLLIYNAAERYDIFIKSHSHILKRIHQYMIAMYLGISPVSLSRIINNPARS